MNVSNEQGQWALLLHIKQQRHRSKSRRKETMAKNRKKSWNWLNGLNNKNKPAGIKTLNKSTMPEWADSYVYKITSSKLNMTYIGYHKENGEAYFGSPTDNQLIKLLSEPTAELEFTIVDFGSKKEMMQVEHELLSEVDARNNPNYWNKTNGIPGVPKFNREAINKIKGIVDNGGEKYLSTPTPVLELTEVPKVQVRDVEYDTDNLRDIQDDIVNTAGSTEKAKPVVILVNRVYDGVFYDELRIGGAHTIESYIRAAGGKYKNTTELNVIRIPSELHEDITDDGIVLLGDLLNARREISSPATHEDGTKYLTTVRLMGRSWKTPEVRQDLRDMGLSSSSISTAYENAQAILDDENMEKAGWVRKDYTSKKHEQELFDKENEIRKYKKNTFVGSSSSAAITWDRIFDNYDKNKTKRHTRITWIVYHTSKKRRDELWPKLREKLQRLNMKYGNVDMDFVEMELYTKDVSKN